MHIDPDKIGAVIGSGGKVIKGISEKTGATINIEDSGDLLIYCREKEGAEEARHIIESLLEEPVVGTIYAGTVKRIVDFGAFIEYLPGKEGLCHISKLSNRHVQSVTDVLKEGQEVKVKLIEIDRMGRVNLSIRDANENEADNSSDNTEKDNSSHRDNHDRRSDNKPHRR